MTNPSRLISDAISEIADGLRRGQTFEFVVPTNTDGKLDYAGTRDSQLNRTGLVASIPPQHRGTVFEAILGAGPGEQRFATTPKPVERGTAFTINAL